MKTTPKQAAYLVLLCEIVARQIATRHYLVCGKRDARRAIASLREARALVATGWGA